MNRSQRRALAGITQKRPFQPPQPVRVEPVQVPATAPVPTPEPKPPISAARLEANRQNAQASTGPRPENFHKISQNALKHGLTGRTILLPTEDASHYQDALDGFAAEFQPVGIVETYHVQALVDIAWRLDLVPSYEAALLAAGRARLLQTDPQEVAAMDPMELEMKIREDSEKAFRNLQLQEHRLQRRHEKVLEEFRELQAARKAREEAAAECAKEIAKATNPPKPAGIVFENAKINEFLNKLTPEAREILIQEAIAKHEKAVETAQAVA